MSGALLNEKALLGTTSSRVLCRPQLLAQSILVGQINEKQANPNCK